MNTNVIELLLVLAAGIGGTAALQAVLRGRGRRSFRLGAHLMRPHR
ncbi:hypothetical protein [Rhodococcus globerulus]|nr:hypothetical protein [Rhodococcus globerulus]